MREQRVGNRRAGRAGSRDDRDLVDLVEALEAGARAGTTVAADEQTVAATAADLHRSLLVLLVAGLDLGLRLLHHHRGTIHEVAHRRQRHANEVAFGVVSVQRFVEVDDGVSAEVDRV